MSCATVLWEQEVEDCRTLLSAILASVLQGVYGGNRCVGKLIKMSTSRLRHEEIHLQQNSNRYLTSLTKHTAQKQYHIHTFFLYKRESSNSSKQTHPRPLTRSILPINLRLQTAAFPYWKPPNTSSSPTVTPLQPYYHAFQ